MPFDFEKIARRALDNGSVDEPNLADVEAEEENETLDLMSQLGKEIDALCSCANEHGLTPADILVTIASVLSKAIAFQADDAADAVRLFRQLMACISDGLYLELKRKHK